MAEAETEVQQEAAEIVPKAEREIESSAASINVSPETVDATRQEQGLDSQLAEVQTEADQLADEAKQEILAVLEKDLSPEEAANYEGNWGEVLRERLLDPKIKEKFIATKREHPANPTEKTAPPDTGPNLTKKVLSQEEVEEAIANYEATIEKVFTSTEYDNAAALGHLPTALGRNRGYGDTGAVFRNGITRDGRPFGDKQKSIIEAHEKAHSILLRLTDGEKEEIRSAFQEKLKDYKDKSQADELLARMSQLKNYFGFKGNEQFTKEQLAYAREHYTQDTGLDNTMSSFFDAVPMEKEDDFIRIMNKYAF